MARAADELGGVDILVNNAGTTRFVPLPNLDELADQDWQRIFAVNVMGAFWAARACVPPMVRDVPGRYRCQVRDEG